MRVFLQTIAMGHPRDFRHAMCRANMHIWIHLSYVTERLKSKDEKVVA